MTNLPTLFRSTLIAFWMAGNLSGASAQQKLDACGILKRPNSTYVLQKDVSSPGTCFLIQSEGITLDLNQHTITYGTASSWKPGEETVKHVHGVLAQACWDTAGHADPALCGDVFTGLSVKNGAIIQAPDAPPYSHAIRVGQGPSKNLKIENLALQISSPSTAGVFVSSSSGGMHVRDLTVENRSKYVLNRHQLEGAAIRIVDASKKAAPDLIEGLRLLGGPQVGVVETTTGSTIIGADIRLTALFTNDFGLMLLANDIQAKRNTIEGRSRGIQIDARGNVVEKNLIRTYEEAVNEEYEGCQLGGTYGIQIEARSTKAIIRNNDVQVRATACDARAFRATGTKSGNQNHSFQNTYHAVKPLGVQGRAIGASFSGAKDVLLEKDTIYADSSNAEIAWDGGQNIILRDVTFIKGTNAGPDYATFTLVPGSNNATYRPTRAEMKIINPVFRNGASLDSFKMRPIGFEKWATPAQYSIGWTFLLTVIDSNQSPVAGAEVIFLDNKGSTVGKTTTGADGRITAQDLIEFTRFNTPQGIEKETFTYQVMVAIGERRKEFSLRMTAPMSRTEILP
jgi:hypothetical protein